jgi:hypothetical protein
MTKPIPELSDSGSWRQHESPFRHFRATGVFDEETYASLAAAFRPILEASQQGTGNYRMTRSRADYDARMLSVDEELAGRFAPLFAPDWIRFLYRFMGLPYLDRLSGGLHSSEIGARTGGIHTDFCAAWFDESIEQRGAFLFPDHRRCEYYTGQKVVEDAQPRQYARAAALIYYLCNDGWRPGMGGETSFYGAARASDRTSADLVPPLNNSLVLFECSPHSYHRFVSNTGMVRNSIVMWLHCTDELARSRWGDTLGRRAPR